jgi:hypothetical protein
MIQTFGLAAADRGAAREWHCIMNIIADFERKRK